MNTGYQQAIITKRVTLDTNEPLDIDGYLCSVTGKKQAIYLLEGHNNPAPHLYEVCNTFKVGEIVDGMPTQVYNPKACLPIP